VNIPSPSDIKNQTVVQKVLSFELTEHLARNKEGEKYLAFVGLISNLEDVHSRDLQRKTWFPQRAELDRIAEDKGVILRLVVDKRWHMAYSGPRLLGYA